MNKKDQQRAKIFVVVFAVIAYLIYVAGLPGLQQRPRAFSSMSAQVQQFQYQVEHQTPVAPANQAVIPVPAVSSPSQAPNLDAGFTRQPAENDAGAGGGSTGISDNGSPKVVKSLGALNVELDSLQVINGGRQYLLNLTLANQSDRSIWIALNSKSMSGNSRQIVRDASGFEFVMDNNGCSGIVSTEVIKDIQIFANSPPPAPGHFNQATEIAPGDSLTATARFYSEENRIASQGDCAVQLEFLLANDFNNGSGDCTTKYLSVKMPAE